MSARPGNADDPLLVTWPIKPIPEHIPIKVKTNEMVATPFAAWEPNKKYFSTTNVLSLCFCIKFIARKQKKDNARTGIRYSNPHNCTVFKNSAVPVSNVTKLPTERIMHRNPISRPPALAMAMANSITVTVFEVWIGGSFLS